MIKPDSLEFTGNMMIESILIQFLSLAPEIIAEKHINKSADLWYVWFYDVIINLLVVL